MTFEQLNRFIGRTVTVYTTSGGASGSGFTGVLLRVNPDFLTLINRLGAPPANPLSDVTACDRRNGDIPIHIVGSVCDIPLDKIAAFAHSAI